MKSLKQHLPSILVIFISTVLLFHGPIEQWQHYHEFADQTSYFGVPHALDVFSNLGFLLLGLWYLPKIWRAAASNCHPKYFAYVLFVLSLLATSFGSSYYHLAPDDARLFWDRLPIALACASLIAAIRAHTMQGVNRFQALRDLLILCTLAIASVILWQRSGDLRLYLALQIFSIVLIPLWQAVYASSLVSRRAFGSAILLYIIAKIVETFDVQILQQLVFVSGHSLKHLFAVAAAAVILHRAAHEIS